MKGQDIVIAEPGGEKPFIEEAVKLGFDSLLILYPETKAKQALKISLENRTSINVRTGVLVEGKTVPDWSKPYDEVAVLGTMFASIPKGVTLLCDNEYDREKDYTHQRRSGVSHVTLAECQEKKVSLVTGLGRLNGESKRRKIQVLGRMMQNKAMARKKKVSYSVASLARTPQQMRARADVEALERVIE